MASLDIQDLFDAPRKRKATRVGFFGRLLPSGLVEAMREQARIRREFEHLAQMPDYLLDDVGVTRWQVRSTLKNMGLFSRRKRS